MKIRLPVLLSILLAFAQPLLMPTATADTPMASGQPSAIMEQHTAVPSACPANLKGANLVQITSTECCKDQKGICGCRAGKIVCCDGKPSTHPGCTCHGDDGFIE